MGENFRELVEKRFSQKKLLWIACWRHHYAMPPNFAKKNFANSHKTSKFAKVLPLESFPLYSIYPYGYVHVL